MRAHWPDEDKDRAVDLYLQGVKYKDITAETGVPQATLQVWLKERGITPNRSPRSKTLIEEGQLLERYEAAQREIGRLRLRVEELEAENAELKSRLNGDSEGGPDQT